MWSVIYSTSCSNIAHRLIQNVLGADIQALGPDILEAQAHAATMSDEEVEAAIHSMIVEVRCAIFDIRA